MLVGVYVNSSKDGSREAAARTAEALKSRGVPYVKGSEISVFTNENPDVMLVIGGDGTMLDVAEFCAPRGIPILGINLGSVGFLTTVEPEGIDSAVDAVIRGGYLIEERMLLSTEYRGKCRIALNDIVLQRTQNVKGRSQIAEIEAYIDDVPLYRYKCDGVVCSTPTGSTAYSLSCGGAVLDPLLKAIEIVAVCPHSLQTKPVVVNADSKITLCGKTPLNVIVDGKILGMANSSVTVKRYEKCAKFITLHPSGFYSRLVNKLSKWSV